LFYVGAAGVVGHSKITSSGTQSTIVQAIATLMVLVSVIIAVVATANFYTRGRFLTCAPPYSTPPTKNYE
jgi:uncharacterized membrane protein YidH (DUF202 family)